MMSLNLTNANARLTPHAISNCNAANVHSISFLRKQSCIHWVNLLTMAGTVQRDVLPSGDPNMETSYSLRGRVEYTPLGLDGY